MIELGQIILGVVMGYLSVSVTESLSHRKLLHATNRRVKSWARLGGLGVYIHSSWYCHHVVHHHRTFKNKHVTMFDSKEEEETLRNDLINNGKEQVVLDSYGLRIGGLHRKVQYLYTHIFQLSLMCYFGGAWFAMGIFTILIFYIWVAEHVHPYIHLSYKESLKLASTPMKGIVKSRYFKYLARHHYLHHKYINCNFNLVLGGDYLLGCHRSPDKKDIIEMKKLGLFVSEIMCSEVKGEIMAESKINVNVKT